MIIGSLKDKVFGKRKHEAAYSDVRAQVIGDRFQQPEPPTIGEKFGFDRGNEFPRDPYAPEPYSQSPQQEPFFPRQQAAFGQRPEPRDFSFEQPQPRMEPKQDYDILDRLNLIESQLAAIRSQTETINERLKNMETRMTGRRY